MDEFRISNLIPLVIAAIATLLNIIMWFGRRETSRYEKGLEDIVVLKANSATREELKAAIREIERRQDVMHNENRNYFEKIMDKIDTNEERRSKTEHAINGTVNDVKLQVAVLTALAKKAEQHDDAQ